MVVSQKTLKQTNPKFIFNCNFKTVMWISASTPTITVNKFKYTVLLLHAIVFTYCKAPKSFRLYRSSKFYNNSTNKLQCLIGIKFSLHSQTGPLCESGGRPGALRWGKTTSRKVFYIR